MGRPVVTRGRIHSGVPAEVIEDPKVYVERCEVVVRECGHIGSVENSISDQTCNDSSGSKIKHVKNSECRCARLCTASKASSRLRQADGALLIARFFRCFLWIGPLRANQSDETILLTGFQSNSTAFDKTSIETSLIIDLFVMYLRLWVSGISWLRTSVIAHAIATTQPTKSYPSNRLTTMIAVAF